MRIITRQFLSILYGKIEDYAPFLTLLDGYFSAYDKRILPLTIRLHAAHSRRNKPLSIRWKQPATPPTAVVYFGYALKDATAKIRPSLTC